MKPRSARGLDLSLPTPDGAGIEAGAGKTAETASSTCPVTKGDLRTDDLVPNHALRRVIQAWCVANNLPPRRLPASPLPAPQYCSSPAPETASPVDREELKASPAAACPLLATTFTNPVDFRCKSCLLHLSFAAASESSDSSASSVLLNNVLAVLVLVMPLDEEAIITTSVALLANVAKHGDLQRRLQAVVVIMEIFRAYTLQRKQGTQTVHKEVPLPPP
uniref:U-box domain-containing protein n=1 Tax=Oryza rufipogon TaxID=4529 RepID=A0A0E0PVE4_ORYRU